MLKKKLLMTRPSRPHKASSHAAPSTLSPEPVLPPHPPVPEVIVKVLVVGVDVEAGIDAALALRKQLRVHHLLGGE